MLENKDFLLTLTGPSGSGKSTIEKIFINNHNLKRAVSHTSREMRISEHAGVDYYYVNKDIILKLKDEGKLAEFIEYNGNYYGVTIDELMSSQVITIEPHGLEQVREIMKDKKKIISIYLDIDPEEAKRRMLNRGDQESAVNARIEKDSIHFKADPDKYDYIINAGAGKISDIYNIVNALVEENVNHILDSKGN